MELGWLVGLLEGEGTFGMFRTSQVINLQMSDEDVVYRYGQILVKYLNLHKMPNIGVLSRPNRSEMYQLTLRGEKARQIMRLIVPYMGTRRRARIWRSLNGFVQEKTSLVDLGISIEALINRKVSA